MNEKKNKKNQLFVFLFRKTPPPPKKKPKISKIPKTTGQPRRGLPRRMDPWSRDDEADSGRLQGVLQGPLKILFFPAKREERERGKYNQTAKALERPEGAKLFPMLPRPVSFSAHKSEFTFRVFLGQFACV